MDEMLKSLVKYKEKLECEKALLEDFPIGQLPIGTKFWYMRKMQFLRETIAKLEGILWEETVLHVEACEADPEIEAWYQESCRAGDQYMQDIEDYNMMKGECEV